MRGRLFNFRNILFALLFSIQVAWNIGLLIQMINCELKGGIDYLAYYSAGYIVHYDSATRLYDLDLQRSIQKTIVPIDRSPRFYPFNHPPFLTGIMGWVTTRDYNASYFHWNFVLAFFHLIGMIILLCLMRNLKWPKNELWIFGISILIFYPIFIAYLKGQDSAFLLLGVSLWTFGLLSNRTQAAGLGLALAFIRPQIALVLVLPFLIKRRQVFWWFLFWGLILLIYSIFLVGTQGLLDFVQVVLFTGQGLGFDLNKMITLMGAVLRLFPDIEPQTLHIIGYSGYALVILFLCFLWAKSRTIDFKHIGLAILLSMVFSPHTHNHDFSLLLVPILGVATALVEHKVLSHKSAVLLPLGVSVVLTVNESISFNTLMYLLILVLGLSLWFPSFFRLDRKEACES